MSSSHIPPIFTPLQLVNAVARFRPSGAEVRYEEGKGLQAYLDLITAQLRHLPRAPAPPAGAPEFTSSDCACAMGTCALPGVSPFTPPPPPLTGFYHLSWQQPELTGGLALATFTALFAVGVQEVSWLQLVLYALAGVVAFGGLLSIANALVAEHQQLDRPAVHVESAVVHFTQELAKHLIAWLNLVSAAAEWREPLAAAATLSGLWTMARWLPWVTEGTLTCAALLAFSLPAAYMVYYDQVHHVWGSSVLPQAKAAKDQAMALLKAVREAAAPDSPKRTFVYAGIVALVLLVGYVELLYLEPWTLVDTLALTSLAVYGLLSGTSHKAKAA